MTVLRWWILLLVWGLVPHSAAGARAGEAAPEIREPLFAFMLTMARRDSVGQWTGDQLRQYALERGQGSRLPLDTVVSLSRQRTDERSTAAQVAPGRVVAVWRLEMVTPLKTPLPYSILGYHPGSLRVSQVLELAELGAVARDLRYRQEGELVHTLVTGARVFALSAGSIVLDADGWLDALLGSGLDDYWTLGFVTARAGDRMLGLTVNLNPDLVTIYGEFDFKSDKVLSSGSPLAGALSRWSGEWLNPQNKNLPRPWPGR